VQQINFIFEHGKGCSGKDTQAHFIREHLGASAIELSTGDIFRGAISGIGEYGRFKTILDPYVEEVNKRGGYIPDEPIVEIVKIIIAEQIEAGKETFIFTGFPRTLGQLNLVDEMVKEFKAASMHLYFDISDETVRQRAKFRREEYQKEGKEIRSDDDPKVVEDRLVTFRAKTLPMLEKLGQEERLIYISGEGSIPEVERETSIRLSKER
jgi:adenylate kinase family enzyme